MRYRSAALRFLVLASAVLSVTLVISCGRASAAGNSLGQLGVPTSAGGPSSEPELRAELAVVRDYDQRMQDTVYWSLGVVVFMTILLAGFGWYTNFRVYGRDLAGLRAEVRASVEREMSTATNNLGEIVSRRAEEIAEGQEKLRSAVDGEVKALRGSIKDVAEEGDGALRSDLKWLQLRHLELEIKVRETLKEPEATILRDYVSLLGLALDLGVAFMVASSLRTIEDLLKKGTPLPHGEAKSLTEALDALPPELAGNGDIVRSLIPRAMRGV